ncbi:16S rRNA (guanine(966)-N(2))-methyltransferase RsmD [Mesomycoplasma molare]|uniref:16S rRNA (Guanine(966)-N(2))-methyltransferase RsmD n=1 Tax=Mesomycoplasma molare TaxID=171288 RepID=A0ABY5TUZ0_9BACT|nr:16S rRNA (guanine(966)-N(2))-methyltransferase RsmD [Mesomycoplasma molare]UWD34462.1 16S rRNA (guanine(966)-N(2))-methyltransferase RsmD [Mesomycoplasma molare]
MLRIIAGKLKGRKIEEPDLNIVRPTTDRVRESIFSSIQFEIEGTKVLDLFSGSGAISFEFISRGAKEVFSSEKNRKVFNLIEKNQKKLNIENLFLFNVEAFQMIELFKEKKFDFIYLDPPYNEVTLLEETCKKILENDILDEHGTLIVETNTEKIKFSDEFLIDKKKKYGKTFVFFIKKR